MNRKQRRANIAKNRKKPEIVIWHRQTAVDQWTKIGDGNSADLAPVVIGQMKKEGDPRADGEFKILPKGQQP